MSARVPRKVSLLLLSALFAVLPLGASVAEAASVTTLASASMSAGTVNGTFTSLTGPVLAEASTGDIGLGTIVLNAPSGFVFDTGSNVTATATSNNPGACGTFGSLPLRLNGAAAQTVTPTSNTITVTVTQQASDSFGSCRATITWSGIKVRPSGTLTSLPASQNITKSGTSAISGITAGSTNFGTLTETKATTTTTVTSNANPSTYGSSVTFTATITNGHIPAGTVQFKDGAVNIGSPVTVSGGQAQLTIDTLTASPSTSHSITAVYVSSDGENNGSTSATLTQTVDKKALTITANSTSKTYGDTITFAGTEFSTSGLVLSDSVTSVTLTSGGAAATAQVSGSPFTIVPTSPVGTGLANYTVTLTNGALTVNKASATITANSTSKTYGQTVTFAGTEFTHSTLLNSDTVTSVTLTSAGAADTAIVAGSPYTITPSAPVGTGVGNYTFTFTDGSLTVNQKTLTVTATGIDKVYDGTTDATVTLSDDHLFTDVVTTGFTSATFSDKNVGTAKAVSVSGISITGGAAAGNYVIGNTTASTSANITQKPITVTPDAKIKTFGNSDPVLTSQITAGGPLAPGDSFTGNLGRSGGENVGTYLLLQNTLTAGPNYNITFGSEVLTITPRPITVTPDSLQSKIFGATDPAFTFTSTPLLFSDTFSGSLSRVPGENAGTYLFTLGTLDAGPNYALTIAVENFTITAKSVTVTPDAGQTKVYGQTDPSFTFTSTPLEGSDTISGDLGRASGEDVGDYAFTLGTLTAGANYTLTLAPETFAVTPKILIVNAVGVNKIYDGFPTASVTFFDNREAGDDVTIAFTSASFADKNVGLAKPVSVSGIAISGGTDAGNYTLGNTTASTTADINARTLTIGATGINKVYDSFTTATVTLTDDRIAGDDVTTAFTTADFDTPDVGTAKAVTVTGLSITGGIDAGNYSLGGPGTTTTADITAKSITVTPDSGQSKIYGELDPAFTFTSDPLIGGDTFTGALSRDSGENVGTYAFTIGSLSAGTNYSLTLASGTFEITPKALTITADNQTKVYGQTFTFAGTEFTTSTLVAGDSVTGVDLASPGTLAGADVSGNPYAIVASNAVGTGLSNYTITYVDGVLTISQASSTTSTVLGVLNPSIVGTDITFTATITGGTNVTGTVNFLDGTTVIGSGPVSGGVATYVAVGGLSVGSHSMTAEYLGDGNNTGSTSPGVTLQVVDKASPVTSTVLGVANPSIVGQNITFTADVTGGFTPTGDVEFYDGATLVGTVTLSGNTATFITNALGVGSHSMTAVYLGDGNNLGSTSASVTLQIVDKATPITSTVVGVSNPSIVGNDITFTAVVEGFGPPTGDVEFFDNGTSIGTATLSATTSTTSTATLTIAGGLSVGTHPITATYGGDGNNTGSTSATSLQQVVDKATPVTDTVLAVANPSVVGTDVTFTATVTGGFQKTGTVDFFDNGILIGTSPLSGDTAVFITSALAVGTHPMTATYSGDANNNASTSAGITLEVVTQVTSSIVLADITSPRTSPFFPTLVATVTGLNPSGNVTFRDNGAILGTVSLSGNTAALPIPTGVSTGTHAFTADFSGDVNNTPANSNTVIVEVVPAPVSETVTADQGSGGTRGEGTHRLDAALTTLFARFVNPTTPPPAFGGTSDVPLSRDQKELLKRVVMLIQCTASDDLFHVAAVQVASAFGGGADVIEEYMHEQCDAISLRSDAVTVVTSAPRVVQLSPAGFPLSSNPVWNLCVQGIATLEDIRRNTDGYVSRPSGKFTPYSCDHYKLTGGNTWKFPKGDDPFLTVTVQPRKGSTPVVNVPRGYVLLPQEQKTAAK